MRPIEEWPRSQFLIINLCITSAMILSFDAANSSQLDVWIRILAGLLGLMIFIMGVYVIVTWARAQDRK